MSKLRFNFIIIYKYLVVGQPLLALFHLFTRNPLFQPLQISITNQGNFKPDPFSSFPLQISLLSFFQFIDCIYVSLQFFLIFY